MGNRQQGLYEKNDTVRLLAVNWVSCSKDKSNVENDCGVLISLSKRNDGGVEEKVGLVACGADWHSFDGTNVQSALLFNKGATALQ